jgi:hypothetical protein
MESEKFVFFSAESVVQDDCDCTNTIGFALQMEVRRAGHLKEFFKTLQSGDRVEKDEVLQWKVEEFQTILRLESVQTTGE